MQLVQLREEWLMQRLMVVSKGAWPMHLILWMTRPPQSCQTYRLLAISEF